MGMELKIYDVSGRLVRQWDYPTIRQSDQVTWDGKDISGQQVPAGVYFVRLETSNKSITKKIIKLK
jgi:flagellar hook assembly protein FlgD